MIKAAIDLGTNTCLLLIAEWDPQKGVTRIIEDHSTVVRLGEGVDSNRTLDPEAKKRTRNCLVRYADRVLAQGLQTQDVVCVATSQARDAEDGPTFFGDIEYELGLAFRVLSGEEEARATFVGGLHPDTSPDCSAVIDIGGGSTEYMGAKGGVSVDMGSVRFTERYLKSDPVTDEEFWACQEAIDAELDRMGDWRTTLAYATQLVGVAGTVVELGAWFLELKEFDRDKLDALTLSQGDVHRMVEELKWRTLEEKRKLPFSDEKRADVILAGAMILWRSMEKLRFKSVRVSTRGLRFGVMSSESEA